MRYRLLYLLDSGLCRNITKLVMLEYVGLSHFNAELFLCGNVGGFAALHGHMVLPCIFVYIYTAVCLSLVIIMLYEVNFCLCCRDIYSYMS